jgi:hypothetical protein
MSALPLEADIRQPPWQVRFGPIGDTGSDNLSTLPDERTMASTPRPSGPAARCAPFRSRRQDALLTFHGLIDERLVPLDPRETHQLGRVTVRPKWMPRAALATERFQLLEGLCLGLGLGLALGQSSALARLLVAFENATIPGGWPLRRKA